MECPPEFRTHQLLGEAALKQWLKSCGNGVKVFEGSRLVGPENIEIGDYSQIDEGVRIFAGLGVQIGRHVHLAFYSSISGGGSCVLGDFVGIGAGTRILTGTDLPNEGLTNPTIPNELRAVSRQRTEIQRHAIVFTNCVVFPGVMIGEGAVISAGSIVHRNIPPWSICGGNPLIQIGQRSRELIEAGEEQLKVLKS